MNFTNLHPAEQLSQLMRIIYNRGLTSSKGGNLSIKDEDGNIWITPGGCDKQNLTADDIILVKPDGEIIGKHPVSVELPFHKIVYGAGDDIHAILHAHAPALVMFSLMRKAPDTYIAPDFELACGDIGIAAYGRPGSDDLGYKLKSAFESGARTVIMENHGVCVASSSLDDVFMRFEAAEQLCHVHEQASHLGQPTCSITRSQYEEYKKSYLCATVPSFSMDELTTPEKKAINSVYKVVLRAYARKLLFARIGAVSERVNKDTFVISPDSVNLNFLDREDLVVVRSGRAEYGKKPSHYAALHKAIYDAHPEIKSLITALSPNLMAFAVTGTEMNSLLIPETFCLLHNIPSLSFDEVVSNPDAVPATISKYHPLVIMNNIGATIIGEDAFDAFVTLEVAEDSAYGIVQASSLGEVKLISGKDVDDIIDFFKIEL